MNIVHLVVIVAVVALVVWLWLSALVSISRQGTSSVHVAVWIVLVVAFPILGSIAWFWAGRPYERMHPADSALPAH